MLPTQILLVAAAAVLLPGLEAVRGAAKTARSDVTDEILWTVEVEGGRAAADKVAADLGVVNMGQVGSLKNYYHFQLKLDGGKLSKRALEKFEESVGKRMGRSRDVNWFEKQEWIVRSKRDFIYKDAEPRSYAPSYEQLVFNDRRYPDMWYLQKVSTDSERAQETLLDIGVAPVWARGFTGKGVVLSVIDDGLEWNHTDIFDNYTPKGSYDYLDFDNDPSPSEAAFYKVFRHGTRCTGQIAMIANNDICGVGVAFNAKVAAIRLLGDKATSSKEASALSHNISYVDIYSNSWGPNDDGKTMDKPNKLTVEALRLGVTEGRSGLGVLYVFASGNGGMNDDNCNCDGFVSSIYSFSISSVTRTGSSPIYAERCASTLATTFTTSLSPNTTIITTDVDNQCTDEHGGTSAAAPLAAGVFALLLERNAKLSWRDVKHIVAWTAQYEPLRHNPGWLLNGAGFRLNDAFGFGLLNAEKMIDLADPQTWKSVPPMKTCQIDISFFDNPRTFAPGNPLVVSIFTDGCANDKSRAVNFIEHVVLTVTANYTRRGDITITMQSAMNTNVTMMSSRRDDSNRNGLINWPMTSVQNWGESPRGNWTIYFEDLSARNNTGHVQHISLTFYGTQSKPDHYSRLSKDNTLFHRSKTDST